MTERNFYIDAGLKPATLPKTHFIPDAFLVNFRKYSEKLL